MVPARLIERKREGEALNPEEIERFFRGYLDGEVADYQMSAFCMAVCFSGLTSAELNALLEVMLHSGTVLDLSGFPEPKVDKHSTGGVGDKVSLPLAPLAAELGLRVPMMSGAGLGHTGGTLDKLQAIPGFRTDLPLARFVEVLAECGCAMTGQTAEIAPLDRRLYDLRNATGTVESLPLIASSIMSKKLAEGLDALVLDVKVGDGAFLPTEQLATELARTMVALGEARGVRTVALLTAMDRPLGRTIGNALELREAVACLRGEGPADLREITLVLAAEMAVAGGVHPDLDSARRAATAALDDGRALARFARLARAQGGDGAVIERPELIPRAPVVVECRAPDGGVVESIAPRALGRGLVELGGGRRALGDRVDPTVGFVLHVAPGDRVQAGDLIGEVHARDRADGERGRALLEASIALGERMPRLRPLVSHRVKSGGIELL